MAPSVSGFHDGILLNLKEEAKGKLDYICRLSHQQTSAGCKPVNSRHDLEDINSILWRHVTIGYAIFGLFSVTFDHFKNTLIDEDTVVYQRIF